MQRFIQPLRILQRRWQGRKDAANAYQSSTKNQESKKPDAVLHINSQSASYPTRSSAYLASNQDQSPDPISEKVARTDGTN